MHVHTEMSRNVADDVYQILVKTLRTDDILTDSILDRILSKRGKGIRPFFMALITDLIGGSWDRCQQSAAVIEAIHLASLLHDDVVDCSDLRRGVETINASHSDKVSILYGDHIFVTALHMARELDNSEAVTIIFNTVTRMIRGEISETLDNGFPDEDTYLTLIGDKTASLFAAAGELSVVLNKGSDHERLLARNLGNSVGIMFQIVDDTLDYNGDRAVMGKPTGVDALAGHMTLPLIYSVRDKTEKERQILFDGVMKSPDDLCLYVRERGGIEYALSRACEYAESAQLIVEQFENRQAVDAFGQFLDMLLHRHA